MDVAGTAVCFKVFKASEEGEKKMNARTKEAMFNLRDELEQFSDEHKMITVRRSDLEAIMKHLFFSGGEWSNQSAYGYAIAAAESMELSKESREGLVAEMRVYFDEMTLEEAADIYRKSDY